MQHEIQGCLEMFVNGREYAIWFDVHLPLSGIKPCPCDLQKMICFWFKFAITTIINPTTD
jgi:hypothetical protein